MPVVKTNAQKADAVLRDIVRLFAQVQRSTMACCAGATAKECEALLLVARHEGLTVQAFAERMGLEKTWASRLLVRMENRGLVRRVDNPADSRSLLVEMSPKGLAEQRKLAGQLEVHAVNLLRCVPAAERANVERALVVVRDALAECVGRCASNRGE